MLRELHLLRRHGHGEPRAARRRHLLRVGRHHLGESLRALDGASRSADAKLAMETVSRRRRGQDHAYACPRRRIHARRAAARVGWRWIRCQRERRERGAAAAGEPARCSRGGRSGAMATRPRSAVEHLRRAETHLEVRRYDQAHVTQVAAAGADADNSWSPPSCGVRSCLRATWVLGAKAARRTARRPFRCSSPRTPVDANGSCLPALAWRLSVSTGWSLAGLRHTGRRADRCSLTPFIAPTAGVQRVLRRRLTPAEFEAAQPPSSPSAERVRRLEAATVAFVQAGETHRRSANSTIRANRPSARFRRNNGRPSAGALVGSPSTSRSTRRRRWPLVVTYVNELGLLPTTGNFDVLVDGTSIARFEPNANAVGFFDAQYAVPAESRARQDQGHGAIPGGGQRSHRADLRRPDDSRQRGVTPPATVRPLGFLA